MTTSPHAKDFDLLVIGAGSGGATVAMEAAALGISCAVFDPAPAGGTCVHRGCVPKKLFWHAADIASHAGQGADYAVEIAGRGRIDYKRLHNKTRAYVNSIGHWYESEFARLGVALIRHSAQFKDTRTLVADGVEYRGKRIVIAAGSAPNRPGFAGGEHAITSEEFFDQGIDAGRVAIVGSGYIAIELACALAQTGARISLVVRRDRLSSHFDAEMLDQLARHIGHLGVDIRFSHPSAGIDRLADGSLQLRFDGDLEPLSCDCVLWAVGRAANTAGLALDRIGVACDDKGFVKVDQRHRTNVENIYALGDIIGRSMLTPVAIRAGRYLVRHLYKGEDLVFDYSHIPTVIYAHPPMASIGLTEEQARARHGEETRIWRSRFVPLSQDLAGNKPPEALIKLIALESSGKIIGLHILAPGADEMMQGFAVAVAMGATKTDFDRCVALHPTVAEEVVTLK